MVWLFLNVTYFTVKWENAMPLQASDMRCFVSSVAPFFSSVVGAQISQCFLQLCSPVVCDIPKLETEIFYPTSVVLVV